MIFLTFVTFFGGLVPDSDLYLYSDNGIHWPAFFILFIAAVVAYILELFSHDGLFDDNIVIPIGSGLTMVLLLSIIESRDINYYFYSARDLLLFAY